MNQPPRRPAHGTPAAPAAAPSVSRVPAAPVPRAAVKTVGLAPTAPKPVTPPAPPVTPVTPVTPAAPPVAANPVIANPGSSNWKLPPDDGWADDGELGDDRRTPQNPVPQMPHVRAASPVAPPVQPAPPVPAANVGMTPAMRDEVRMIARLAIDDALAPYARAQREMEARLERLLTRAPDAVITHLPMGAPPPVTITAPVAAPVAAPAPVVAAAPPAPVRAPPVPVPASAVVREATFALSPSFAPPAIAAAAAPPDASAWPPVAHASLAPRALVIDASDIDIPPGLDGSRRRKMLGWTVAVLLVIGLAAMIAATALSHSR